MVNNLTVWKYVWPLPDEEAEFDMPLGAEILCAREQYGALHDQVAIWARVSPSEVEQRRRKFRLCGTGHPAPADLYIGTAVTASGLVWHVFEVWP